MIEKLKEHDIIDPQTNKVIGTIGCDLREIMDKLNELVDAVNELQLTVSKMENLEHLKKIGQGFKNLQDPYAEQRKWIGKLCWIWDDDGDERTFAKLTEIIEDDDRPFKCFTRWKHCEPVKPDDNIIYKKEQQ